MSDPAGLVRYVVRCRLPLVGTIAVSIAVLPLLWPVTVPNLLDDPGLPPNRLTLLVSCALACSICLLLQPVESIAEALAARDLVLPRLVNVATVVGASLAGVAIMSLLAADTMGTHPVTRDVAGLTGVGLTLASVDLAAGLAGPWLMVLAIALFGYQQHPGGPETVRPWAWVLADGSWPNVVAAMLLFVGVVACVLQPGGRSWRRLRQD